MRRAVSLPALALALAALALAPAARAQTAADGGAAAEPAAPPDPDAPTVTVRADKTEAHVGDPITVTLTAISKRAVRVNIPGTLDLGAFSLLDRKESEQDLGDGRMRHDFTLQVAAYEPGEKELPALEVTYLGKAGDVRTARAAPLPIKIASLIANEPEPVLEENAPPVEVMQEDLLLAYIVGGVLAAALGALLTWTVVRRLRGRALYRPGPPPRPAHEIALEKLDRLGTYGFLEDADNRPFYFAVSEIIREYLGGRFAFDSLELTTDELVAELRQRAARELGIHFTEVEGWLSSCDLVKFAKISPSAAEARGALETAIRIVSATRPRTPEAAPGSGAPPTTGTATGTAA